MAFQREVSTVKRDTEDQELGEGQTVLRELDELNELNEQH